MNRCADLQHEADHLDDELAALDERRGEILARLAELDEEIARETEPSAYRNCNWHNARCL